MKKRIALGIFLAEILTALAGCARTDSHRQDSKPLVGRSSPRDGRTGEERSGFEVLRSAVEIVFAQSVEARPLVELGVASLRGIERLKNEASFRLLTAFGRPVLVYEEASGTTASLDLPSYPWATQEDLVRELERVVQFVEQRTSKRREEVTASLIRGLMTLDPNGAYLTSGPLPAGAGIGVEVTMRQQALYVVAAVEGTPAAYAGLRSGDRVLEIDGRPTGGLSTHEAVGLLRGAPGSMVRLRVAREEWTNPRDVEVTREVIRIRNVITKDLGNGIFYLRLRQFQEQSPRDIEAALERFDKAGMKALVLDLRNDPGGLLTAAVEITEKFIDDGKLVVYTEGRVRNQNMRFTAHAGKAYRTLPVAVLINRGTAAAAEIVAATLQDWGRAALVGERTFGRVWLTTDIRLEDGSTLRLTTSRWFTPKGRSVDGVGVAPDVEVLPDSNIDTAGTDPRKDNQLRRALEIIPTLSRR